MAARDRFHGAVKQWLIRAGWTIADGPLRLRYGGVDVCIDLAAEQLIAAEKAERKIAIKVKSFLSESTTHEFHLAVGQFVNYRIVLEQLHPERALYLAVPSETYHSFFEGQFAQLITRRTGLRIIVYESEAEVIERWIN